MKIGIIEAILMQVIAYSAIFFINPYIGFLLCLIIGVIAFAIFIISIITEMVERSKVPKSYYKYMVTAFVSPILVLIAFVIFDPTALNWMIE